MSLIIYLLKVGCADYKLWKWRVGFRFFSFLYPYICEIMENSGSMEKGADIYANHITMGPLT